MADSLDPEELRRYFAERLPIRLAEIEDACRAARETGWTGEPLKTFHRLAHSLAGAGATFGFPAVSEAARGLERLLKEMLAESTEGTPPYAARIEEVERALAALASPSL
jgi:HPt (histidine-containing phosphotransfer) domain-containing protein